MHHHISKIAPMQTTSLKKYMKNFGTGVGEFSRSHRFLTTGQSGGKTSVCRAVVLLKNAIKSETLNRIQQGKITAN